MPPSASTSSTPARASDLHELLESVFGFGELRPGQAEIIDRVLAGRPTLAVMPTGAGKSLCYQLPALSLPGVAIVVSPLIALMRDQVAGLRAKGVNAAAWTSACSLEERRAIEEGLEDGSLKLLYVAPERFRSPRAMERILAAAPSLFVVDEVHCVSQWGHDFRPDYARLGEVLERLRAAGPIRFVGLTATATEQVRADIASSLGVADDLDIVVTGFDRPNLALSVTELSGGKRGTERKVAAVADALESWMDADGSAIVYAPTRRHTEEVAAALSDRGFDAEAYHAGLSAAQREQAQATFEAESSRVVVATNAFGMGIDKPDVRVVVHLSLPDSPEAYYQEVGRAGRDGLPAAGVLLWDPADLRHAHRRLEAATPSPELVMRIHEDLVEHLEAARPIDFDGLSAALEERFGPAARAGLAALERAGDLVLGPDGVELAPGPSRLDPATVEARTRHERNRLSTAVGYVTRAACRRRYLVDYFGDARRPDRCGACDLCLRPEASAVEGEVLTAALKVLSCVARMRGRFGKTRVAEVLLGAKSKPLMEAGLDALSTYGLLSTWPKADILSMIDSLVRAGLVALSLDAYPKVAVTETGAEALRARGPIRVDFQPGSPRSKTRKKSPPAETLAPEDRPIFEALRTWRFETAKEAEVPAYVVASNALLAAIAAQRPSSPQELSSISGMGANRMAAYGDPILSVLRQFD